MSSIEMTEEKQKKAIWPWWWESLSSVLSGGIFHV